MGLEHAVQQLLPLSLSLFDAPPSQLNLSTLIWDTVCPPMYCKQNGTQKENIHVANYLESVKLSRHDARINLEIASYKFLNLYLVFVFSMCSCTLSHLNTPTISANAEETIQ